MVTRAWGSANGQMILFVHTGGDRWEATVPFDDDGEYIVELYAEDNAGNTGYLCTMLFAISGHEVRGYIVPRGFNATGNTHDYTAYPSMQELGAVLRRAEITADPEKHKYILEIQEGGYKIERTVCSRSGH